jgi:hypothetical protein
MKQVHQVETQVVSKRKATEQLAAFGFFFANAPN